MKEIRVLVKQHTREMIVFRQDLRQHPELQFEGFRATEKVVVALDQLGITYCKAEPTGLVAEIVGSKPDRMVALRMDMGALPVQELDEDLTYKSLEVGKMHVCGHDSRTVILVTMAKVLGEIQEELQGAAKLVFQPSEENAQGAKAMVVQGAMTGVDGVFGLHIWSRMPVGTTPCRVGSSLTSADIPSVGFKGRGGHGAMPNACINAAVIASSFVMNLQTTVSRETDPLDPVVITTGRMDVGTRFNAIAKNIHLEETACRFSVTTRNRVERALQRYAEQTVTIYGGTASLDHQHGTLPVINDEQDALFTQTLTKENFDGAALKQEEPAAGGEDFSYYTEHASGCFALMGSGNPEKDTEWAHHHSRFSIDEDAMTMGAELYAQYAFEYLKTHF